MKKIFYTTLLIGLSSLLYAQSSAEALKYMNSIDAHYAQLSKDTWEYTKSMAHNKNAKKIDKRRTDLLTTINNSKKKIKGLPPFQGDKSYRDSVVIYLDINYAILNHDYSKLVDMEAISEQSYDAMEAYLLAKEKADEKFKQAADNLKESQATFAKNNNITLSEGKEDDISRKLKQAGKVYKYYNEVYLIFFKSFKQEAYLVSAYGTADIGAMEQNKEQLLIDAKEGIQKINKVQPFDGDNSLKSITLDMLKFYKDEAENRADSQIDFFIKKENFEKIKTAFDGISEKKRTQSDIDRYNKALEEYNNGIETYNKTNDYLNKTRQEKLNKWNSTGQNFTHNHIEK